MRFGLFALSRDELMWSVYRQYNRASLFSIDKISFQKQTKKKISKNTHQSHSIHLSVDDNSENFVHAYTFPLHIPPPPSKQKKSEANSSSVQFIQQQQKKIFDFYRNQR